MEDNLTKDDRDCERWKSLAFGAAVLGAIITSNDMNETIETKER
jgi:hypothetical protein